MTIAKYGQAFTYDSLSKNGTRPIIYSALGAHPNFAVLGTHSRNFSTVVVNDYTSAGPLWDPTVSAYYYAYAPSSASNGTFTPLNSSDSISWLYFLGRWGDEQYLDSDPRQVNLLNLSIQWKYMSGPTGPLDKDLNRTDVCPSASGVTCTTLTALPATSGPSIPVTVTRFSTSSNTDSNAGTIATGTASWNSSRTSSTAIGSPIATGESHVLRVDLSLLSLASLVVVLLSMSLEYQKV